MRSYFASIYQRDSNFKVPIVFAKKHYNPYYQIISAAENCHKDSHVVYHMFIMNDPISYICSNSNFVHGRRIVLDEVMCLSILRSFPKYENLSITYS